MRDWVLSVWVTNFGFDLGRYVLVAVPAFLVFWVWGRERFRHRLVQGEYPAAANLRREIAYSASTVLIFSCVGTLLIYGKKAGFFRIYDSMGDHGWAYFAFTVVLLIVLHDTYFYWTHRAMHHRALFNHVHLVHHRSSNPSPFAAYAFAPAEAVVQAAYVPLMALVVPVHTIALFVFLVFMILRNVLGHLGIELFPAGFIRSPWSRWSTTTTHHNMHHRYVRTNYGLYFTFWDRVMGTMDTDYEHVFAGVTTRKLPPSPSPGEGGPPLRIKSMSRS
jgi:Delta7-sterol 5-desaturase